MSTVLYISLVVAFNLLVVCILSKRPTKDEVFKLFDLSCDDTKNCVVKRINKLKKSQEDSSKSITPYLTRNSEVKDLLDDHLKKLRSLKTRTGDKDANNKTVR